MSSPISYGTDELADLCSVLRPASPAGYLKSVTRAVVRHPSRLQSLHALLTLPVIEPRLSVAEQELWRRGRWPSGGDPLFGGHWVQAVVDTSSPEPEYLTGRHRQAVRTNINRAREQGMDALRADDYDEFFALAARVYAGRRGGQEVLDSMLRPLPPGDFAWYCARMPGGDPLAIAVVALFSDLAVLAVLVGDLRNPYAGYSRYLLHNFIRNDLRESGVRHLLVGSVLRQTRGNQYFQRLLGYRICNIRPVVLTPSDQPHRDIPGRLRGIVMRPHPEESPRDRPRRRRPVPRQAAPDHLHAPASLERSPEAPVA